MICDYGSLDERKVQIRREDDGQYFDFEFPPQIFKTKIFLNAQELNREIIRAGIKSYFRRGRVFLRDDYKCSGGMRTVFRCKHRECTARLLYHKKSREPILEVITFKNLHNHKKSKDPQKAKRQEINQYIMNLSGRDYEEFRNVKKWMEKFDLSNREALYIVEQLYWMNNTENQILTRLSYEGRYVRRFSEQGETMVIFIRTDTMRKNFLALGEAVYFQLSYDTLRKPSPFGNKYSVGFFYVQDQNLRLCLVSACMISKESVRNFKKVFEFFFQSTCQGNEPICFITDDIKSLTVALREVRNEGKYGYYHLYSWYHVIENLKPILKQLKNGRNVLDIVCKALQQFNEDMYERYLEQLKIMLKGSDQIYNQFVAKEKYYTVRRIPRKFQGYAITTLFGGTVRSRTKQCTVYRVHTGRLFYKLIQIQAMLQKQMNKVTVTNTGVLKHYPEMIGHFQDKLEVKIMDILVKNYSDSKDCRKDLINPVTFKVFDRQGLCYSVKFTIEFDHWECECHHLVVIGIPCSHLLSVILDPSIQASISYYVNSRWYHSKQESIPTHSRPGISNKRRRP